MGNYESSTAHKTMEDIQEIGKSSESTSKSLKETLEEYAKYNYAVNYAKNKDGDYLENLQAGYKEHEKHIQDYHDKHKY